MPGVQAFDFQIKYNETDRKSHFHEIDLHTHAEFELYINLAGNVSFLVEDALYPLSRGDVIIARPGEHHHCVYRDDSPHKLYWILFDSDRNGHLLDFLQTFRENYISPREEWREELIALCGTLHGGELTAEERMYAFLRIFAILRMSRPTDDAEPLGLRSDMQSIIRYIGDHISEPITVTDVARVFYISQSTLERRFREVLDITPLEYIRRKKMIMAAEMLRRGESVLHAGMSVGFRDTSYFISIFRRYYGVSPSRYRKMNLRSAEK